MPKSAHFLLRGFLFLLAAVLRFWDLPNLPLMHDELSAWSRLQYASFQELIELGVKPDGHPAGVQVFLWFWVKCFGDKPWVIKFPFILMGLGSLFFAYQIGKKWFSENTALLLVACMATQQFAISLGANVARPYASGLFLSLLMVWAWTNFIEKKGSLFITLSYLFASVLCLYNHHFTALFAGIVWLSGFYLTKDWKRFLLLALGMFVLYFPHLPIFMNQFQNKGLEWLGKPDIYFVKDYFGYIFHYSIYVEIFILILFSYSLYKNYQLNTNNSPTSENLTFSTLQKRSISLLWFFLPLLIGYAYSVLRAPLLQFSMLIFTYPFLLLFLFSYTEHFKKAEMNLAVFALISLNLLSLIYKRQHFDISYHQPHKAFYEYAARETPPQDSTLTYYSIRKEYVEYYAKQEKKDISARYLFKDVNNLREWEQQLQQMKQPHLVLGNMPYSFVKLANRYFPYLKEIEKGFTYEIYELSKKGTRNGMGLPLSFSKTHEISNEKTRFEQLFPDTSSPFDWLVLEVEWESDTAQVEVQGDLNLVFKQGNKVITERKVPLAVLSSTQKAQTTFVYERILHLYPVHLSSKNRSFTFEAKVAQNLKSKVRLKNVKVSIEEGNEKIYKWVYE